MGSYLGAQKSAATKAGVPLDVWLARRQVGDFWCYSCRQWNSPDDAIQDSSRASQIASICRSCRNDRSTASHHGLRYEELIALRTAAEQSGCPICGRAGQKMEVDHNHLTGKVRGLLCSRCNGALGQFLDDAGLLEKAIQYLRERNG